MILEAALPLPFSRGGDSDLDGPWLVIGKTSPRSPSSASIQCKLSHIKPKVLFVANNFYVIKNFTHDSLR